MIYEIKLTPEIYSLASAGAALLGLKFEDAILRPISSTTSHKPITPHSLSLSPTSESDLKEKTFNLQKSETFIDDSKKRSGF